MLTALQAVVAPLIAAVEARFTVAATLAIRRALLLVAAVLFGIGALLFLSVGVFFGLMPGLGPGGAALLLAFIWALLAGFCVVLARLRPRVVVPPAVAAYPAPPVAAPPPPPPAAPVVPVALGSRLGRLRTSVSRAAPLLAVGALIAGIIAGRR